MSDFQRLPNVTEVLALDQRWLGDLQLAYQLYAFQHNNNPLMQIADAAARGETEFRHDPLGLSRYQTVDTE